MMLGYFTLKAIGWFVVVGKHHPHLPSSPPEQNHDGITNKTKPYIPLLRQSNHININVYLSFFLGRSCDECPHFLFLQLVALGGRRA